MTDREMGDAIGRTETAVTSRRGSMGLLREYKGSKPGGVRPWSKADDEQLKSLFGAGLPDDQISIELGRTAGSVGQRRSSLGLLRREQPERLRRTGSWSTEEDTVMTWMFNRGWTDEKIGREMRKTACAIKDRRQSLGLWRGPRQ
jgi:hypothetical protein